MASDLYDDLIDQPDYLSGLRGELEEGEQDVLTGRTAQKKRLSTPVQAKAAIDVASPAMRRLMDTLIGSYERDALKNQRDLNDVVKKKMEGKNPYLVILTDFLTGYGNPQARSVREKLFEREMVKKQLRTKSMAITAQTLQTMGMTDVRRLETRTAGRRQQETAENARLGALEKENQATRDVFGKTIVQADKAALDLANSRALAKTNNAWKDANREDQQAFEAEQARLKAEALKHAKLTGEGRTPQVQPKAVVDVGPMGNMVQPVTYERNAAGEVIEVPVKGALAFYDSTSAFLELRKEANTFHEEARLVGSLFNSLTYKDASGAVATRTKLKGAIKSIFALSRVTGFDLSDVMPGWELNSDEALFMQTFYNQVITKVKSTSGQQVTDKEREYVERTLPDLFLDDATFGVGMQMVRLYSGLSATRANDSIRGENGTTKFTHRPYPGAALKYIDYSSKIEALHRLAVQKEAAGKKKGRVGEGARWLAKVDATRPDRFAKIIEEQPEVIETNAEVDAFFDKIGQ